MEFHGTRTTDSAESATYHTVKTWELKIKITWLHLVKSLITSAFCFFNLFSNLLKLLIRALHACYSCQINVILCPYNYLQSYLTDAT